MEDIFSQTTISPKELALYEELLECLEEESQALVSTREEAILAAAARKEALLERLLELKQEPESVSSPENHARLEQLKRQVAAANARNREIALSSLELIREFLAQFQPPGPGLYQMDKPATAVKENALFNRRA